MFEPHLCIYKWGWTKEQASAFLKILIQKREGKKRGKEGQNKFNNRADAEYPGDYLILP